MSLITVPGINDSRDKKKGTTKDPDGKFESKLRACWNSLGMMAGINS